MIRSMPQEFSCEAGVQLERFCRQYLQLHQELDYPDAEHLRKDTFQQSLYHNVFKEGALKYPPPLRYQLRVLKELTKRIEQSIQDWEEEGVSDDLMNSFSSLLAVSIPSEASAAQQKSYVTYTISSLPSPDSTSPTITILESRNLLAAAGVTGLRTWEAAFCLGDYLSSNQEAIIGKSVLELGAGTGYISILCAKYLEASHVLATDGSDDVVASLSTNFYLNDLQDSPNIEAKELKWGQALMGSEHPEWNRGRKIDVVLGADVTYDGPSIIALLSTVGDLFDLFPEVSIIVSAHLRNQETFNKFLTTCKNAKYGIQKVDITPKTAKEQTGPFHSGGVSIEIYQVTKT